ncbi:hypothetical protein DL240_18025 [Lujinxingia litoralis]|uniref:Tetratricopeptide repeat protein n=1 Tax=Lujinxingia litoralis TaxID=2211119 RepID=A0A328C3H0_9DELT|nr:hypothetical protein [Lujinxingia litoralis]RAL20277.1 hypothetical protein DL240_18025 [Lujinxingia litoralis]
MSIPTKFEPKTLRELPLDDDALQARLLELTTTVAALRQLYAKEPGPLNASHLGRALQQRSLALRLQERYDEARQNKDEAIAIWRELGRAKATFLCRLQRALIDHQQGAYARAAETLEALEAELDAGCAVYTDQLAEARARCYHALGRRSDALAQIARALQVRQQRGNPRHIEATLALRTIITEAG